MSLQLCVKKSTDKTVLKTKISLNCIGQFMVLGVGSALAASDVPDNRPLHDKLFFRDSPSGLGW